jgi:hypothetical protein
VEIPYEIIQKYCQNKNTTIFSVFVRNLLIIALSITKTPLPPGAESESVFDKLA